MLFDKDDLNALTEFKKAMSAGPASWIVVIGRAAVIHAIWAIAAVAMTYIWVVLGWRA